MEIDTNEKVSDGIECYKVLEKAYGCLSICHYQYDSKSWIILWNKFSIIVKDLNDLTNSQVSHHPDFLIKGIFFIRNIFLCLDFEKVLYFTILRETETASVILEKIRFKSIQKDVYCLSVHNNDVFVLLKKDRALCIYKYNVIGSSKMKLANKYKINLNEEIIEMRVSCLNNFTVDFIENVFETDTTKRNMDTEICLFYKNESLYLSYLESDSNIFLLYGSPVPIKGMFFENTNCSKICLVLMTGSLVVLSYDYKDKNMYSSIIHLSSTTERIIYFNESFLYTDGVELWLSTLQNNLNEFEIKHTALKIQFPFDFTYHEDSKTVYCTNHYSNIYTFKIDLNAAKRKNKSANDFVLVEKFNDVNKIFCNIQHEMKINSEILELMSKENYLINVIALSRKLELISEHVISSFKVYNNSLNVLKQKNNEVALVCHPKNYFEKDVEVFFIQIELSEEFKQKFNELNTTGIKLWHIDVAINLKNKISVCVDFNKTNCTKFELPVAKKWITLPFDVTFKLVALIPENDKIDYKFWSILPSKAITVDYTFFFKMPSINLLKRFHSYRDEFNVENKLLKLTNKMCSTICNIENIQNTSRETCYSYYLRLPDNFKEYVEIFAQRFLANLESTNAQDITTHITDENFMNGVKALELNILDGKMSLSIEETDSKVYRMKISSHDNGSSWSVYLFVLNILKLCPQNENITQNIPHFDFMLLQTLREHIDPNQENVIFEEKLFFELSNSFDRDIIGILPI